MSILEASFIQKYKNKSIPQLIKIATTHVNAYVRKRDTDEYDCITCISCNKRYPASVMHAGHYKASTFAATRFYLNNIHGQCPRCNTHLHGNLIPYRENLIKKVGEEEVLHIETMSKLTYHWDRFSLIDLIATYQPSALKRRSA